MKDFIMAFYQSFDTPNHQEHIQHRVKKLRIFMQQHNIDGYFIPSGDAFCGEYVPEYAKRLEYITGFTGSWGLSLVGLDFADLYTDSRYKIQAPEQTDLSIFTVICTSDMTIETRLSNILKPNMKIGYDAELFSVSQINKYKALFEKNHVSLVDIGNNLIDKIWDNPPPKYESDIIIHPEIYAGQNAADKIQSLVQKIQSLSADCLIVVLPESVCWVLNLRGNDVPHTPFILSRAIIYADGHVQWFVGKHRITPQIKNHLPDCVSICEGDDFYEALKQMMQKKVICDFDDISMRAYGILCDHGAVIISAQDPILLLKSVKNISEQNATLAAHRRDGAAVIKFMHWFEHNQNNPITEIDCVNALEGFRREAPELMDLSFDTIAGSGGNGAIVHYHVTKETNRTLGQNELFLCDSGGQYLDGTTDITRVFVRGTPTLDMKMRYTQVLKGHLAVARAKFPPKTTGAALDAVARSPLWQAGIDFDHGTGHGVGLYLSVHEGPQSISARSTTVLQAGMLLSNEPGYYQENDFGIRIENVELVVDKGIPDGGNRTMLGFETLTLVPYEVKLIDISLLDESEIQQINAYHARILTEIRPFLNAEYRLFLENVTAPLVKLTH